MNTNRHAIDFDNYKKVVQQYKFSIPNQDNWSQYKENLDGKYLYEIFYGKSFEDVWQYFYTDVSMSKGHELLYAPKPIFQYYIHSFILFLLSDDATNEPDSPSVFLNLLISKEYNNPKSVAEIFHILNVAVEYISNHQDLFDSDIDIW